MKAYQKAKIVVIGLGYVGLPLAVEFGKMRPPLGFDIDTRRVAELRAGFDHTLEVAPEELVSARQLQLISDVHDLKQAAIFIVTVPTPVDDAKRRDVSSLLKASETVGAALCVGDIVIYESTVFPGCTEEVCVPVHECESGLKFNADFFCGSSPEGINPGNKEHRLPTTPKVTSGSNAETADTVDALYREIITAGTYRASSIKVAEAAKVIENAQRDVNIALMNELSLIFHPLDIDTIEVLEAAGTKWNFLPFRPGLVGGHRIGVDPYYLTHRAQQVGYHLEVILSGRKINDQMGSFDTENVVKLMIAKGLQLLGSKVLMMGLSFKENCPDIRNTRAIDIVAALRDYSIDIYIYDPWVKSEEALHECGLVCKAVKPDNNQYDAIVVAVGHSEFNELGIEELGNWARTNH